MRVNKKQTGIMNKIILTNKNTAFTLSEVMITLVIIGVVAAISLPALFDYHNQQDIKNHYKKMYSTIKQAVYQTRFSLGYAPACYYKMERSNSDATGTMYTADCPELFEHLIKKVHVLKKCETDSYTQQCLPEYVVTNANGGQFNTATLKTRPAYVLQDGTLIFLWDTNTPIVGIDANGFRGPNKGGEDLFTFRIGSTNGSLLELRPDPNQPTEPHGMSSDEMLKFAYTTK